MGDDGPLAWGCVKLRQPMTSEDVLAVRKNYGRMQGCYDSRYLQVEPTLELLETASKKLFANHMFGFDEHAERDLSLSAAITCAVLWASVPGVSIIILSDHDDVMPSFMSTVTDIFRRHLDLRAYMDGEVSNYNPSISTHL